jgi:hypothetical protein
MAAMGSIAEILGPERPELVQRYSTAELAVSSLMRARHEYFVNSTWLDPYLLQDIDTGTAIGIETLQGNRTYRPTGRRSSRIAATAAYYWTAAHVGDEAHDQIAGRLVERGLAQAPVVMSALSPRQQDIARGLPRFLKAVGEPALYSDLYKYGIRGFEDAGYVADRMQLYATETPTPDGIDAHS